ncbi:MAG: SUMF1/EgtB/PvdO family nonheme iron enzyme [Gammaproteobacteria bacterium]|nr:SUMF1/EgtB/PvdO family nonheme iron enzyme [Gammaproteobacteria bacterium]
MSINKLILRGCAMLIGLMTGIAHAETDCNAVTEISVSECQSLLHLYNNTNGEHWNSKRGWNITDTPCSWAGVVCKSGKVTRLILSFQNITGFLPNLALPALTVLELEDNRLRGGIPNFSNLPALTKLDLSRNLLGGTVPDFNNLPVLTELDLAFNRLTGTIPDFSNLPALTGLYLHDNQLIGSIPDFSNLPALTELDLSYNQLTGTIPDFSNLPALTKLDLHSLPGFARLDLYGNQLTGTIPDFSNLPALTKLGLYGNLLSGSIPNFSKLPVLTRLDLSYNRLSGSIPDFSNLPALTRLGLRDNQLSGSIPDFSNLPVLTQLNLSGNQLIGSIPDFSNLPVLTKLYLHSNQLSGRVPNLSIFDGPIYDSTHLLGFYYPPYLLGDNCGLMPYDTEQEIQLNQQGLNWNVPDENCGIPPSRCAIYSPEPPNLTIPCLNVNGTVYRATMNLVSPPSAPLRFEADMASIEQVETPLTKECAVYPFGPENRLHMNCMDVNGDKLWAELAPVPSAIQFDVADFGKYAPDAYGTLLLGEKFHDILKDGSQGPRMAVIPSGTFRMGDIQGSGDNHERPVHDVSLSGFAIGVYEVTFRQYDYFRKAEGEKPASSSYSYYEGWGRSDRPVIDVSWHHATAYAEWLSEQTGYEYRLPTEAEWEYAARAGSEAAYSFGNDESRLGEYAWYSGNAGGSTQFIGQKSPNDWGLYNMHGNVQEWVQDWHGAYSGEALTNPNGSDSGSLRVARGGGWDSDAVNSRLAYRAMYDPGYSSRSVGFRLVRIYPY